MTENKPLISIVTPSYNQGEYLKKNIESIQKQDYPNIEHIVIDGGSSDSTLSILSSYESDYNLKWVSEKDNGQSHAINKGFAIAGGEIVLWLNSDDSLLFTNSLSIIESLFNRNPEVDIFYGNRLAIRGDGEIFKIQYTNAVDSECVVNGYAPIFQENVFFRKYVVKDNPINEDLHVVMDTEYWIRLLRNEYNFKYTNNIFCCFRIHESNKTVDESFVERWNEEKDYLKIKYNARRFKINKSNSFQIILHKLKSLWKGVYNNYVFFYRDLMQIVEKGTLATEVYGSKKNVIIYFYNSIKPYMK